CDTQTPPYGTVPAPLQDTDPSAANKEEMAMNRSILWSIGLTAVVTLVAAPASDARGSARKTCSATAAALYTACKAQTVDDTFVAKAKCLNVTDSADRTQ